MHIVARPQPPPRRRSSYVSVVSSRVPVLPSAWPSAMAPPLTLRISGSSSFHSARQASDCDANASLSSTAVRSPQPIPARSSALFAASTGPMP
jgi:hypothetical protein